VLRSPDNRDDVEEGERYMEPFEELRCSRIFFRDNHEEEGQKRDRPSDRTSRATTS